MSIAFCDEKGVMSVSDLVDYNLVDDFVRHLGLKHVPGMRLRGMLHPPTSGLAGHLSDRQASPSNTSSNKPSPETAPTERTERAAEPSFWPWGQPGSLIATDDLPCMQVLTTARGSPWGQVGTPWDFRSLLGLPAAENKARLALEQDGFALRALLPETDARLLRSLEALLQTERPEWLGKGKDVSKKYGPYDSLKLACAWKVDHPRNRSKYTAGVERVQQELELLEKKGKNVSFVPGLPVKTDRVRGFNLSEACNEVVLLHGTNPDRLLDLLSTGLNERFSGTGAGTAFGDGVYLAEDAGKTDQYVSADSAYDPSSELHKRLYDETVRHPDDVFYVLVVRAALGFPVRTQHMGKSATSMDNGAPIFPVNYRELSAVPAVTPPIFHHSLIAELGKVIERYREFVLFHSEYVHIDFVLAYHRCNGGQKLRTSP